MKLARPKRGSPICTLAIGAATEDPSASAYNGSDEMLDELSRSPRSTARARW